jgi:hypothetical protein
MSRRLWFKGGRIVVDGDGRPVLCPECPCRRCEPKNLHEFSVDGRSAETRTHDLSAWAGDGVGWPGGAWRLLETSDCFVYASGVIDENGKLAGLPAVFESQYHYRGWMLLQQGCVDEFGAVQWPPSRGCENL